jgi:glutamate-1-semialdehyde 2,1-aminomutase
MSFDKSRKLLEEASQYLPGGVNSNFRTGIQPTPLVFERGEGPYLFDVDGNRYVDYYLGMGPMILGHKPQQLVDAVQDQLTRGILFGGQSEVEFEVAKLFCEMVPCADRVRFSSSGSEAVQAALRLSRAATGRNNIVKFEGHYHGWFDNILWSHAPALDVAGPADAPTPIPGTLGQDPTANGPLSILPWNNIEVLEARLRKGDVAAVIMEASMCNTSAIPPKAGYLEAVRQLCTETGTILIFDEVITGFRVGPGGAQERLGVTPDLATFGKAVAAGFPVAALAGRADLMDLMHTKKVMYGGTYNSHPVNMAATLATLQTLKDGAPYARMEITGKKLMDGIAAALAEADIPARIQGYPQVFHVAFGISDEITDYRSAQRADKARYVRFTSALIENGVRALERGVWFLSDAHTDEVIDETIAAVQKVAKQI